MQRQRKKQDALIYKLLPKDVVAKLGMSDHRTYDTMQPAWQFSNVFLNPRGDSNENHQNSKDSDDESGDDHNCSAGIGPMGGGKSSVSPEDLFMPYLDDFDDDDDNVVNLATMAADELNALIPRMINRNRNGHKTFCW